MDWSIILLTAVAVVTDAAANPGTCVVTNCAGPLARCLADSVCRPWMFCTPRCAKDDLACQIRCGDVYKPTDGSASKIDDFSECIISEHHCVPQQKLSCSIPRNAKSKKSLELETLTGTWYVTRGWNPIFDCFDCQVHHFSLQQGAKPLVGDLKYSVKKVLNCKAPDCEYLPREVHQSFAQDPQNPMHLINHNNSAKEMNYMDDWYVLAARPNVYTLIYYCGCNDACCGYSGSVLYMRSPHFEDLASEDVEDIKLAIKEAQVEGFDFQDLCAPSACALPGAVIV